MLLAYRRLLSSFRTGWIAFAVLYFAAGCASGKKRPLTLAELKEEPERYMPTALGSGEQELELTVVPTGDALRVEAANIYEESYEYRSNEYVRCRVDARGGKVCEEVSGKPYRVVEQRRRTHDDQPWALRIQAITGETLYEQTFEYFEPQEVHIDELDRCAVPEHVVYEHRASVRKEVIVQVETVQNGERISEQTRIVLPFMDTSAYRTHLRDRYRALLHQHLDREMAPLFMSDDVREIEIGVEDSGVARAIAQADQQLTSNGFLCGQALSKQEKSTMGAQIIKSISADKNTCLEGHCRVDDEGFFMPRGSTFTLTINGARSLSWRVEIGEGGEIEITPLGFAQTARNGGPTTLLGGGIEARRPTIFRPLLPLRFLYAEQHENLWTQGVWFEGFHEKTWALDGSDFYTPAACEPEHPICTEESSSMYTYCQLNVCADAMVRPDVDEQEFSAWRQRVEQISGNLILGLGENILQPHGVRFEQLQSIHGALGIPVLSLSNQRRRVDVDFPRLTYVEHLLLRAEDIDVHGGTEPFVLNLPHLAEVKDLHFSSAAAGLYLQVDAPRLRRIQNTLFIGKTSITQSKLTRLVGAVEEVGGSVILHTVVDLDSLRALENLRVIHGDLIISGIKDLQSLDGLQNLECVKGSIIIEGNPALRSLRGLSNLRSVGSETCSHTLEEEWDVVVQIQSNPALRSLDGLEQIERYHGVLEVTGNPSLRDVRAVEHLNVRGLLFTWGSKIERMKNALQNIDNKERFCWLDARTAEQVKGHSCFVTDD